MPDLFITPTRWDLLRAVDAGWVTRHYPLGFASRYDERDLGPGQSPRYRRVTAGVEQLDRAGLVTLRPAERLVYKESRRWALNSAGVDRMVAHTCVSCRGYTRTAPTCATCRGRADDGN